jgi:hypothetical protein
MQVDQSQFSPQSGGEIGLQLMRVVVRSLEAQQTIAFSTNCQPKMLSPQGHTFIQSTILYDGLPRPSIDASRSATALEGHRAILAKAPQIVL